MIEKVNDNEFIVHARDESRSRKLIISKPGNNYRVEVFDKKEIGGHTVYGRALRDKNKLRYFQDREKAVAYIHRIDSIIGATHENQK